MENEPESPPPEYESIMKEEVKTPTPIIPSAVDLELTQLWLELKRTEGRDETKLPVLESPPEYSELIPIPTPVADDSDEYDPWDISDVRAVDGTKWADLATCNKVKRVTEVVAKLCCLLVLLYLFICSLDFLGSGFRLLGGKVAGGAFSNNAIIQNPIAGLMIGILGTVLLQSSSTSTSIIVTMVASGMFDVRPAIPVIMGANIGTSVTNTIVSMAQSGDRNEFRRAFGGATVHDMFNFLSVIVLLPIEVASGYLYHFTKWLTGTYGLLSSSSTRPYLLKKITKPFTKLVIQLDKHVIEKLATGDESYNNRSLIKTWCGFENVQVLRNASSEVYVNESADAGHHPTLENVTQLVNVTKKVGVDKCVFLFNDTGLSDAVIGVILLIVSLALLCTCLVLMVKLLHSMLQGQIASAIKKTINADFPGKLSFLTGYVAILVGAGMTILVQSSSIFTSAMTPLVGMGVISIERMYPLTLGANIGTTATGILAALASSSDKLAPALQVGLCHLFFNVSGILLFFPIPHMRKLPISLAKKMGNTTAKYRWFAIFYLVVAFFLVPATIFGLSMAGPIVCFSVLGPVILIVLTILIINILQRKHPAALPIKLQNWDFLPVWMHSLEPVDNIFKTIAISLGQCCPDCCDRPTSKRQVRRDSQLTTADLLNSTSSSEQSTPTHSRNASVLLYSSSSSERSTPSHSRSGSVLFSSVSIV